MTFLLDVNVLLAILHAEHAHADVANTWLARHGSRGQMVLCRVTQMGVLRMLTKKAVMGDKALSGTEAWAYGDELRKDTRFVLLDEPPAFNDEWRALSEQLQRGAAVDTDTYLAAFAQAGGHTLVTFDGGFARFPGLSLEPLTP